MNGAPDIQKTLQRMTIEPMRETDLDQVLSIEKASFKRPWTREGFLTELKRAPSVCLVLREKEALWGYLIYWYIRDEIHILDLAVDPDRRWEGLATLLLDYMFAWGLELGVRHVYLEVRESNRIAQALYRKAGFVPAGRRKQYYAEDREDALMMIRDLDP